MDLEAVAPEPSRRQSHQILAGAVLIQDAAMLRTVLDLPDALTFAHHLLQLEPNDPEVHLFYINTFFRREEIDAELFRPDVIDTDCSVTLRRGGDAPIVFTIVDGEDDTSKNWISKSHPLATQLLGKKAGNTIRLNEGGLAEAEYVVLENQSKYLAAFQDCLARFNERFPAHYGMSRVELPEMDITKIVLMLERKRARGELILDLYRRGQLPACTAARMVGISDAEFFRALINDQQANVLSFSGKVEDLHREEAGLTATKEILLETSALITLASMGLLDLLPKAFDGVYVTQQTIDALANVVLNLFPEKQGGHLFSDSPGHIQLVDKTSEEAIKEKEFYEQLLTFTRTRCSVLVPAGTPALEQFEKPEIKKMLGSVALSVLATATDRAMLILSDDLPLQTLARSSHGTESAGSLSLLRYLRKETILSIDAYGAAIQWLVDHSYSVVSIGKDDILWVLKKNGWSPTPPVSRFLSLLAGPANDALPIGFEILYAIWSEPLVPATKQFLSDLLIHSLCTGQNPVRVIQTLQVLNNRRSTLWTPAMEGIQAVLRNWRPTGKLS